MPLPFEITVGGGRSVDPVAGDTKIILPDTIGRLYYVEQREVGPLTSSEILKDTVQGGFELQGGLKFNNGDKYFIHDVGEAYTTSSTSYTNGFNIGKVLTVLFGRVGWSQVGTSPVLNSNNLVSKGGRKFNDGSFHSLVTLSNIKSVMDAAGASDADFNAYLESLQRAIILRSLNGIFSEPEYITQSLLYSPCLWNNIAIPNMGKFIGVQIKVPPRVDIATQIDSVALYFDSDVTFDLYLFNDLKKLPVSTIEVSAVANTQTIVSLTDIILNHVGGFNHGGIFYLGYFQDDLGAAKAIRESDVDFICNTPYGYEMIQSTQTETLDFDRRQIQYTCQSNGLNPFISVWRDHTWMICAKASLFDNVLGLQMAAAIVEQLLFTTRSNGTERALSDSVTQIMGSLALDGVAPISDGPKTTGLRKQIDQELKRMKTSFFPKPKNQTVNLC